MKISPILAMDYAGQDPTGWLMSEKLDGIRALWDGHELRTRSGVQIHAPGWFTAALPKDLALDGELWGGRGTFEATNAAVRRKVPNEAEWRAIKFMAFDAPTTSPQWYSDRIYSARIKWRQAWSEFKTKNWEVVSMDYCQGTNDMINRYQNILAGGGEGIVLRKAAREFATYSAGRSNGYLRLKPVNLGVGTVVTHVPNQYRDGCASLLVEWDGRKVKIGSGLDQAERTNPPALGSKVTFEFRGLTDSGAPRQPTLV